MSMDLGFEQLHGPVREYTSDPYYRPDVATHAEREEEGRLQALRKALELIEREKWPAIWGATICDADSLITKLEEMIANE